MQTQISYKYKFHVLSNLVARQEADGNDDLAISSAAACETQAHSASPWQYHQPRHVKHKLTVLPSPSLDYLLTVFCYDHSLEFSV